MNLKKICFSFFLIIFIFVCVISCFYHCSLKKVSFQEPSSFFSTLSHRTSTPKRILLINTEKMGFGGREIHTLHLYKALKTSGHQPFLLLSEGSSLEKEAHKQSLSYFAAKCPFLCGKIRYPSLYFNLLRLCSTYHIDIIHCDVERDLSAAKACALQMPLKVVFTQHRAGMPPDRALKKISGINGLVGVNKHIAQRFAQFHEEGIIACPSVAFIPPFFNHERFIHYPRTTTSSQTFLKNNYGIETNDLPVFASVARLDPDKNLFLLIDAFNIVINQKNKKAHLLMIGSGSLYGRLKKRVELYNLEPYIHFLGFCSEIPTLLSHVQGAIITTKEESFGIALAEAGLMRTIPIGPTNTGAEHIIIDNKTGRLFENNNEHALAALVEELIEHPEKKEILGDAAHDHVLSHLTPPHSIKMLDHFYSSL